MTRDSYLTKVLSSCCNPTKAQQTANAKKYPQGYFKEIAERQNFVCAICGKENFPMGEHHTGCLVVDHDHKRGIVRGLLCHNCNRALGLFQDKSEIICRAFSYLQSVTTIPKGSTPK